MAKPSAVGTSLQTARWSRSTGWDLELASEASSSQAISLEEPPQNLLVQWRAHTSAAQRDAIHRELGTTLVRSIHTLPMKLAGEGVLDLVQAPLGSTSLEPLLRAYSKQQAVKFAEPDSQVGIQLVSNDPSLGSLWGMQSTGYGAKATTAWGQGFIGSTATVSGVIDSGIDYTHPDLYLNIWLNQGEIKGLSFYSSLVDTDNDGLISFRDLNHTTNSTNTTAKLTDWNSNGYIDAGDLLDDRSGWEDGGDNDGNGFRDDLIGWDFVSNDNDPYDDNGHGTHVAGTIGGMGGNAVGVAGVNWQAQMAALKFLNSAGSGSLSSAVQAIDYFTTAKIQSSQRGETSLFVGTNNSWGGGGYSQAIADAINRANQQDLLFIAAAGNGGSDGIGDNNDQTPSYPSSYTTNNVIAVAAITSSGSLASYSNYGATSVDLGAPGSGVYSTVPGGGYATYNGTSMATPHVTGAASLLKSAFPNATAAQIKEALLQSAASTGSLGGKTVSGGRLDIAAALDQLDLLLQPGTETPAPTNLTLWGTAGNDVITGGTGNDQLAGISDIGTTTTALGRGQIDTLTGGAGSDRFLLADSRGTFYNDRSNRSQGTTDYALITDFNASDDVVQLRSGSQYLYRYSGGNTEIFLGNGDNRFNTSDELIARLSGVNLTPGSKVYILASNTSWASFV
jgi:subtilisin family serine protease